MKLQEYINRSICEDVDFEEELPVLTPELTSIVDELSKIIDEMYVEGGRDRINEWVEKQDTVNEGFIGGALGFLTGPMIGKIVARALGVRDGVLYDMLTSRLVSLALGSAIQKAMK